MFICNFPPLEKWGSFPLQNFHWRLETAENARARAASPTFAFSSDFYHCLNPVFRCGFLPSISLYLSEVNPNPPPPFSFFVSSYTFVLHTISFFRLLFLWSLKQPFFRSPLALPFLWGPMDPLKKFKIGFPSLNLKLLGAMGPKKDLNGFYKSFLI